MLFGHNACVPADSGSTTGTAGTSGGGRAGTTGAGGSGTQGTAGDSGGPGTAGNSGNPGAGGNQAGGSTGNPDAATTGAGGNGGPGTGGQPGNPDAGGTGRGGMGGTGAGGAGGMDLMAVAAPLDGQMFLGPCVRDTQAAVCATIAQGAQCPNTAAADIALRGVLTTDRTITLGGDPGTTYSIVLHVQGEVEAKDYSGGTDVEAQAGSPKANGWRAGGTPGTGNNYNVYMIRVTNAGSTAHTDYFLNSLVGPGVTNHTTYGIDYTTPAHTATNNLALTVQGGASLRLIAADSNCSMIKNCGPTANDGNTCAAPIVMTGIEPTAASKNASFNFNTAYNGQWIVVTVKSVTSP